MSAQAPPPPNTSTADELLVPGGILFAITLVLVPARIITRFRSARQLYIDDYLILVAAVSLSRTLRRPLFSDKYFCR
jgi:hypothetical protein